MRSTSLGLRRMTGIGPTASSEIGFCEMRRRPIAQRWLTIYETTIRCASSGRGVVRFSKVDCGTWVGWVEWPISLLALMSFAPDLVILNTICAKR